MNRVFTLGFGTGLVVFVGVTLGACDNPTRIYGDQTGGAGGASASPRDAGIEGSGDSFDGGKPSATEAGAPRSGSGGAAGEGRSDGSVSVEFERIPGVGGASAVGSGSGGDSAGSKDITGVGGNGGSGGNAGAGSGGTGGSVGGSGGSVGGTGGSVGGTGGSVGGSGGSIGNGGSALGGRGGSSGGDAGLGQGGSGGQSTVCPTNPCKNGGSCSVVQGSQVCSCSGEFTGNRCEVRRFEWFGEIPGYDRTYPEAISGDGSVVVGNLDNPMGFGGAFRWSASAGMAELPTIAGGGSPTASALTRDGTVAYGSVAGSTRTSVVSWRGQAVPTEVSVFGTREIVPHAVSNDGAVIVGVVVENGTPRAFRGGPSGKVEVLGVANIANASYAYGVSGDGKYVVGIESSDSTFSTRWGPNGEMEPVTITLSSYLNVQAVAISRDGNTVVGFADTPSVATAFRWRNGVTNLVSLASASPSYAQATNADGSVVVGRSGSAALIWDEAHGARLLHNVLTGAGVNLQDWTLAEANLVSDDGKTVVGIGTRSDHPEAFIARLP